MNVYFFDGTRTGFYTAVFNAYKDKSAVITSDKNYQLGFGDEGIAITNDTNKSARVQNKLFEYDDKSPNDVDTILRSDGENKEQVAFLYIRAICKAKAHVREMFGDELIFTANRLIAKVGWETDKMYGLLRFIECKNGVFYAPYEPDCDITEIIVAHFIRRLKNKKFIIHDVKRKFAALYNGNDCFFTQMDKADVYISDEQNAFEELWKEYYNCVNIESRKHTKQMKGSMPIRYWKYLPEKQPKK